MSLDLECESDGLVLTGGSRRHDLAPCDASGPPAARRRVGFAQIDSYLHVYLERDDLRALDGELRLVKAFAHYTGDQRDSIRERYARVHDDVLYEKRF